MGGWLLLCWRSLICCLVIKQVTGALLFVSVNEVVGSGAWCKPPGKMPPGSLAPRRSTEGTEGRGGWARGAGASGEGGVREGHCTLSARPPRTMTPGKSNHHGVYLELTQTPLTGHMAGSYSNLCMITGIGKQLNYTISMNCIYMYVYRTKHQPLRSQESLLWSEVFLPYQYVTACLASCEFNMGLNVA